MNNIGTLIVFAVASFAAYCLGYAFGKREAEEQPAPTEQAWLEAKKYQIDKEFQYILKLHEEERNGKKDQC